ncbi:ATP-binding cassette, subfamily B [Lutispora thermophila DSM 19022]|uniref:ATP-binding cassette, subfamily B n=1 Tax=Lutispora thermophila DSM 19022 TaxID=1122184 RepID=A0A1M6IRI6_9FIRM|nr:ATP-binding cassette, subfamily B [Lutispora thermophila DSM 19022]
MNLKAIFRDNKKRLIFQSIYSSFIGLYYLLWNVIFLRYLLNSFERGLSFNKVSSFIFIMISISFVYFSYKNYFQNIYEPKDNIAIYDYINTLIFKKAAMIKFDEFENSQFYDLYTRIKDSSETVINIIKNTAGIIGNLIVAAFILIYIIIIDPIIMMFSVAGMLINVLLNNLISKYGYKLKYEISPEEKRKEYVKRIAYYPEFAQEIRTSNVFNIFRKMYKESLIKSNSINKKYGIKITTLNILSETSIYTFGFILPIAYILFNITQNQRMTIGDFSASVVSISMLASKLSQIANNLQELNQNKLLIKDLGDFLKYEIVDKHEGHILLDSIKKIELRNISFKYPNSQKYALKDINVELYKNKKVALVGLNGAGKSTLIKLVSGLYQNYEGEIFINDKNLKDYSIDSYRENVGVVYQDFKLVSSSIIENVLMREPRNQEDYILAEMALKNVGLWEKISSFKDGLSTTLFKEFDDSGAILSGGQLQKLALARVLVKNSQIVIFDEPSSALDPIAEEELYQNILNNINNKIVIFITHRLSTVKLADYIYVIDNGKIIERGTHEELINLNRMYAQMFNMQSEKYLNMRLEECV